MGKKRPNNLVQLKLFQYFIIILLLVSVCNRSIGQAINDLSNVKADELTEDQLRRFIIESDRLGVSSQQIEQFALQNGMNPVEIVKLKTRLDAIRKTLNSVNYQAGLQQPTV